MTTLKDISDTYDCDQLHKNVTKWLKNHTPTADDVEMYLIRLRTINHLDHYVQDTAVVNTIQQMVAQLDAIERQQLIKKLVRPPSTEENIIFLACIAPESPAVEQLLLAAWETQEPSVVNQMLNVFTRNPDFATVLFCDTFLHSPTYLEFLRKSPEHMFLIMLHSPLSDQHLKNLANSGLIDEEHLFPLLSIARQDYSSPLPWIDMWKQMFPDFVCTEAVRIASYLPSGTCMDHFVETSDLVPNDKWKILLEWAGRPEGPSYTEEFIHLMQGVSWDQRKFNAFCAIHSMHSEYRMDPLETLSHMWVEHMPEHMHSYLYPYIVDAKFQAANDWVRQKVILQHETQSISPTKSQRKI